jgi:2-oxoglutarate dehydrogenase E1 component
MYSAIEDHPPISDIFFGHLVKFGDITPDEVRAFRTKFEERLNDALQKSKVSTKAIVPAIRKSLSCPALLDPVETAVPLEKLHAIGDAITKEPAKIELNPKIKRWLQSRHDMIQGKAPVDWSTAEALAFGTLLDGGCPVRLSGQDSRRGTFTQPASVTRRSIISKKARRSSASTTALFRNMRCWALIGVTDLITPTCWCFGKRSLATLPTVRRS